jgi:uncharacterized protein YbcI
MPERNAPSTAQIKAEIKKELLQVHRDSYGTGADGIEVHLADEMVLAVIDVELTAAERTLLAAGQSDAVKAAREAFQDVIAPTFIAIVERATGRTVHSFISSLNIDPLYSIEFFRLAPEA